MNATGPKTGAWLVRHALEQLPVSHTVGIPGVHNTEIYDELGQSETIHPVLVSHECGAAFMGDAQSRTGGGRIGVLLVVPAAGITHAMSGIGEAFLDGIPLLIISGGIRTDTPFGYQLHELDQLALVKPLTKGAWRVETQAAIVPTIFEAYRLATSGTPGPVLVEIPANLQLFKGPVGELPTFVPQMPVLTATEAELDRAVDLLLAAQSPGLFVGWGAMGARSELQRLAELLGAPVATTLQGMGAFPGNHPLHTGMGFGPAAVPAAENAFRACDALLAVGTRFGEIPTGSFGCTVPTQLIHVDINPAVFHRNFPAALTLEGDATLIVPALLARLEARQPEHAVRRTAVSAAIAKDKADYRAQWRQHMNERVNPCIFLEALRRHLPDDAILVVDDGNHTFLAAELFEVRHPGTFISPTDFNAMGYCVPGAIGAKLANPTRVVAGIVGDGAFLMTGLELVTAVREGLGLVIVVFHDGELSQISQGQEIPYNRKTCTVLGSLRLDGIALATGAAYVAIADNAGIEAGLAEALSTAAAGRPVLVDVRIDYSKRTRFTQGVVQTVLKRFPLGDKARFIGRALWRKLVG